MLCMVTVQMEAIFFNKWQLYFDVLVWVSLLISLQFSSGQVGITTYIKLFHNFLRSAGLGCLRCSLRGWRGLSLYELFTSGYSRGVARGPDSMTVSKLISEWLTLNVQDGYTVPASSARADHLSTMTSSRSAQSVPVDMQVLIEHVIH